MRDARDRSVRHFQAIAAATMLFLFFLYFSIAEYKEIISSRVIGYTWCMDKLFLAQDPYGRNEPSLQQILHKKPDAADEKAASDSYASDSDG